MPKKKVKGRRKLRKKTAKIGPRLPSGKFKAHGKRSGMKKKRWSVTKQQYNRVLRKKRLAKTQQLIEGGKRCYVVKTTPTGIKLAREAAAKVNRSRASEIRSQRVYRGGKRVVREASPSF